MIPKFEAAREALYAIERVYLRAAGFIEGAPDTWVPPALHGPLGSRRYRHYFYNHGHAVNAVKYWSRADAG